MDSFTGPTATQPHPQELVVAGSVVAAGLVVLIVSTMVACVVIMKVKHRRNNFSPPDATKSEKSPSNDGGYTNALYERKLVAISSY